ncbi:GroES-like protein [Xylariaceae sp. FL1019]|nr:GroES-like protein [Xylariaceae sp. FL1019]
MPARTENDGGLPLFQTAIKQASGGIPVIVSDTPVPNVTPGTALVRVAAVGLNPTDYKMPTNFPTAGATVGCDFAGTIVSIKQDKEGGELDSDGLCRLLRLGDRVCGAVHGSNPANKDEGSFAEYVLTPTSMLIRIPDSVRWEQAAALGGVGHGTVAQALWSCMRLQHSPDSPASEDTSVAVLVYGGSTATGTMAMQLLRMSGLKPIAVCSTRSFAIARQYGAAAVFDYRSPSCGADIRAYTGNSLFYALDCISDKRSVEICYKALGRAGGKYVCLESQPQEAFAQRRAVRPEFLMAYDMFGKGIELPGDYGRAPNLGRYELGQRWSRTFQTLLEENKISFHPIKILSGKWDGILAGLDLLRKGQVSGTKLVVHVSSK